MRESCLEACRRQLDGNAGREELTELKKISHARIFEPVRLPRVELG